MAKLCPVAGVNGVVKRMLRERSRILKECAFGAGKAPVGSVKGEPGTRRRYQFGVSDLGQKRGRARIRCD
jgi:hypothetical protein